MCIGQKLFEEFRLRFRTCRVLLALEKMCIVFVCYSTTWTESEEWVRHWVAHVVRVDRILGGGAYPREPGNHIPEPRKCNEYSASSICHRHRPHDDSSPKSRYNITIIYVAHLYVDIIVINRGH